MDGWLKEKLKHSEVIINDDSSLDVKVSLTVMKEFIEQVKIMERYREALEFYADDETYKRYYDQAPSSQIENDEGQIANHALKEEGGGAE